MRVHVHHDGRFSLTQFISAFPEGPSCGRGGSKYPVSSGLSTVPQTKGTFRLQLICTDGSHRVLGASDESCLCWRRADCVHLLREQLACSRDLPTCKRCGRISAICEYPPPTDRKALAALRSRNASARAHREAGNSSGLPEQPKFAVDAGTWGLQQGTSSIGFGHHATSAMVRPEAYARHQHRRQSGSEDHQLPNPPLQPTLWKTTFPSSEVTAFLFEIYFSRLYHASLLFHKQKFLSDYAAGNVPDFVALSIFALGSM